MKKLRYLTLILVMILPISKVFAAPTIVILATGGTIAGKGKSSSEAKYSPSELMVEELISSVPGISKIANIEAEQFSQMSSQDMNNEVWLKLAKRVNEILRRRDVKGIVITHGTDTLEETAYFLNLVVRSSKPVILVGSMRPSTALSADGPLNLFNAVSVAANKKSIGKGVLVVFNDHILSARDVSKTHTSNVATFKSNNSGPIGFVNYGKVKFYYQPLRAHTKRSTFNIRRLEKLPKVEIIYGYANQSKFMIENLLENNVDGVVYAGVGNGNIYKDSLESLIKAREKGLVLVRSARAGSGFVTPNAEINDMQHGFVSADNLNPQKARILLMLALTKSGDPERIQELFWKY